MLHFIREDMLSVRNDTNSAESKGLDELKASPSRGRPRNGVFNKFNARNGDHLSVRRNLYPSLAVASLVRQVRRRTESCIKKEKNKR